MPTKIADPEISNEELIQVIRTSVPTAQGVSKLRALLALRQRASAQKADVFASLLADAHEAPRFKHMAIAGLLDLGGSFAEQALMHNAARADRFTAASIAQGLGRIGSPDAVPALRKLRDAAGTAAQQRVDFALSLLAYRHNLDGHEVETIGADDLLKLEVGAKSLSIAVVRASEEEVILARNALKQEPLDVDLTLDDGQRIECGPNSFMLVWNKQFAGARLATLRERKGLAGVLFLKSRFEKKYSISALVLTTPASSEVRVSLHKLSGQAVLAGSVKFESDGVARLALSAVRRPGGAAVEFTGAFIGGRLKIEDARSAATAHGRQLPKPDTME